MAVRATSARGMRLCFWHAYYLQMDAVVRGRRMECDM